MAVDGIGSSDNVVPIELLRRRQADRMRADATAPRPPGPSGNDAAVSAAREGDQARRAASSRPRSAEEQARLVDRFKSETADLPDVRRDKVIEAKLRISTGYYNRDDVRREVLRSILSNLLPTSPGEGEPAGAPAEKPADAGEGSTPESEG